MKKFMGITAIIMGVFSIISNIADLIGIWENHKIIFEVLMLIAALCIIGYSIYFLINEKEYKKLKEKVTELENNNSNLEIDYTTEKDKTTALENEKSEFLKTIEALKKDNNLLTEQTKDKDTTINKLELQVCDGKKYTSNKATITFDVSNKKYLLSFEKKYLIISDAIKWYEGQFYSNKYLESAETSQEYYNNHPVKWSDLNICAELRYKNASSSKFSKTKEVAILQIAEGNNYKKFHIQYKTKGSNDKLPIKKGAEIILNYSYEIPITLWGSYLNRYISYWQEYSEVTLICKDKDKHKLKENYIKVYQTDHITGEPIITDTKIEEENLHGETSFVIKLPNDESCKYAIWWDAEKIFDEKNLNTNMTTDNSQQTQY